MNLAPLKYSRVQSARGGPLSRLLIHPLELGGQRYYQAKAWLSDELKLAPDTTEVFSNADGTGTDRSPMVARHKAISEAMERWAWRRLVNMEHLQAYGFDRDSSTNGIAAYPGLTSGRARRLAFLEAVERTCVNLWWSGRLGAQQLPSGSPDSGCVSIVNPASRDSVVLVWRRNQEGYLAVGSAAARTIETARHQAWIEMERSLLALEVFFSFRPEFTEASLQTINHPVEREILRRALPAGFLELQQRLEQNEPTGPAPALAKGVDCPLPGPWQRYASVWRVLLEVNPASAECNPSGIPIQGN